ncbi:sensor histidine kinase [Streptomyces litchfieldiae]|uniref:histidine kinase n=1 Tax=Streptomyces litchfieldiae TaxID=3075543 RepID=A0ABU2MK23_9ACTN|nr:nitrate- and nitrite sensing domain-containing protein [Streptomyces sp. DSM 44938]MDT0341962.1 nitrate- and nitrite sensing domain-containing protein [Streptomyces sp. DSM 44938]
MSQRDQGAPDFLKRLPVWRTIRGRVTVVLAVPTCLLLVITGTSVADRAGDWFEARDTTERVDLLLDAQTLVRELQRERGLTNGLLSGAADYRAELTATRARADAARRALPEAEPAAAAALDRARDTLARLGTVRGAVDDASIERADALDFYTDAITSLNDLLVADHHHSDRQLGYCLDALRSLADVTESLALERGLMNGVFAADRFAGPDEYAEFTEARAARVATLGDYRQFATSDQQAALDAAFTTDAARRTADFEAAAINAADGSALGADPEAWWNAATTVVDDLHAVQQGVGGDARDRAGELSGQAGRQLAGFTGLGAFVLAVALALGWLATRSITRPLDVLAREANEVADRWLPETVRAIQEAEPDTAERLLPAVPPQPPDSAEEVTRLAFALRDVERAAVELAAEQTALRRNSSESLANLGQRNQRLLDRQLRLITALESQETDPEALADLFELDHLATRMQRNAESLLILTGEQSAAPRMWPGTVPVAEVVRSAISEVEDYRRVTLTVMDPCRVLGACVAELSHLLAELIENALAATPPGRPVEVAGWRDGDEYCLAVVDRGRGMTDAELSRANARLAGRESFLVAPSGYLGHYVVGRLAARLGAQVEVRHTQLPTTSGPLTRGNGVSAFVALPPRLLGPDPENEPSGTTPAPPVPAGAA